MQTCAYFVLLGAFFSSVISANVLGYYWRDWNGSIPSDAYVVENDSKGPVYFAQAYIYNTGLFVGNIKPHQQSIALNPSLGNGPVKYSSVLKIFCGSPDYLMWLPSNKNLTAKITKFVQPVLGGITNNNLTVYVGKYSDGANTYVGSIYGDNYLYYTKQTGEASYIKEYDILIHQIETNSDC